MEFPQYRKLSNDKSYYRIESLTQFIEIQRIGSRLVKHSIRADQYPEMLRIREMLSLELEGIELLSEFEFNQLAQQI
jgi:hypothetical protein